MSSYYEKILATREVKCIDEEIPFDVPQGWEWERWGNIAQTIQYGYNAPALEHGVIKMVRISDIQENCVLWDNVPYCLIDENDIDTYLLKVNDILFARTGGTVGKSFLVEEVPEKAIYAGYLIRTRYSSLLNPRYMKSFMESQLYWEQLKNGTIATAQPNCNGKTLAKMLLPIPPTNEQYRIVEKLTQLSSFLDNYGLCQDRLNLLNKEIKEQFKKSILQEAIQGKLVPQDPNDEPAIELLKRINPDFTPCDNEHYQNLSKGWATCRLEDIVDYEQPTAYIVNSTSYNDTYPIPVLTAGKSFIIGHTNEVEGIYSNLPCIIFDDFTTDSKLVEFSFKVKSSAMKILQVKKGIEIDFVAMFMSITRLIGDTHKRYWISEYSKLVIPVPPHAEQKRIIDAVYKAFTKLDTIMESL